MNEVEEEWRPVPGYDHYEVSTLGRVRSLPRVRTDVLGRQQRVPGRVLKLTSSGQPGYPIFNVTPTKILRVHVLVLETFVGPRPEGMEACHNNGVRTDCRLSNLRWGTHGANMFDRNRHGNNPAMRKIVCPRGHPLAEPNLVAAKQRFGWRECLACARGRSRVRNARLSGRALDLQSVTDDIYADLIGSVERAS